MLTYGACKSARSSVRPFLLSVVALIALAIAPSAQSAETVLHRFKEGKSGSAPRDNLFRDEDGAFYGTTLRGGVGCRGEGCGTVFRLTPPKSPATQWTHTVLYRFEGRTDGERPNGGLIRDKSGALYGTTAGGGNVIYNGTVFKLTPPKPPATKWTHDVLYDFMDGATSSLPAGGLVIDGSGALYGTTQGNHLNNGTVFRLTPPTAPATKWTHAALHTFKGVKAGGYPLGYLIRDKSGTLYGTALGGGEGTVFMLAPPAKSAAAWTLTELYRFEDWRDGSSPNAGLIRDGGALYGTTGEGGPEDYGTVFKLTPPTPPATKWSHTLLHSFKDFGSGYAPRGGLIRDGDGALYGASAGGDGCYGDFGFGCGIVFKLTPPAPPATQWTKTDLHRFKRWKDGVFPGGHLIRSGGALYGTSGGGDDGCYGAGCGTVFKID